MKRPEPPEIFRNKLFEIEHALNIYAYSYVYFPALMLYDDELKSKHQDTIDNCHIYMIGYVPLLSLVSAEERDGRLCCKFTVGRDEQELFGTCRLAASLSVMVTLFGSKMQTVTEGFRPKRRPCFCCIAIMA